MSMKSPFPPLIEYRKLEPSMGRVIGKGGQSRSVVEIGGRGHWLVKLYRDEVDPANLDRLIAFAHQQQLSRKDRDLVLSSTSWPVSRVVDNGRTVGTVIPLIPTDFSTKVVAPSGRKILKRLTLDWLAISDARLAKRGVRIPSWIERLAVSRQLAEVARLFERHGIVYGDWNYGNAFWSSGANLVYVIDIDSCSFGPQRDRHAMDWDDPASEAFADAHTDRYRLALMTLRCLTGEHELSIASEILIEVGHATSTMAFVEVCLLMLSTNREQRPRVKDFCEAISTAEAIASYRFPATPLGALTHPRRFSIENADSTVDSAQDCPNVSSWRASAWSRQPRGDRRSAEEEL